MYGKRRCHATFIGNVARVTLVLALLSFECGANPIRSNTLVNIHIEGRPQVLEIESRSVLGKVRRLGREQQGFFLISQDSDRRDAELRHGQRVVIRGQRSDVFLSIDTETRRVDAGTAKSDFIVEKLHTTDAADSHIIREGDVVRIRAASTDSFLHAPANGSRIHGIESAHASGFSLSFAANPKSDTTSSSRAFQSPVGKLVVSCRPANVGISGVGARFVIDQGSGFVINRRGHVLTANHLRLKTQFCADSEKLDYQFIVQERVNDLVRNKIFTAEFIEEDAVNDLALLKISQEGEGELPFLAIGGSERVESGQGSVHGVVENESVKGKHFSLAQLTEWERLDASPIELVGSFVRSSSEQFLQVKIQSVFGMSGGPGLHMGRVVGVVKGPANQRHHHLGTLLVPVYKAARLLAIAGVMDIEVGKNFSERTLTSGQSDDLTPDLSPPPSPYAVRGAEGLIRLFGVLEGSIPNQVPPDRALSERLLVRMPPGFRPSTRESIGIRVHCRLVSGVAESNHIVLLRADIRMNGDVYLRGANDCMERGSRLTVFLGDISFLGAKLQ